MIGARQIALSLGGRWQRGSSVVRCPAHKDKTPSMSVSETKDGRPLVHCFAGCSQADVINALRAKGLWEGEARHDPSYPGRMTTRPDRHHTKDDRRNHEYAVGLWEASDPINGTLAEKYLRGRGILATEWPDALGFLPSVKHAPSGKYFPCMVAALTGEDGQVVAIQRTYLDPDGQGKAKTDGANKMTLGAMGRAAVRLSKPQSILGIAEGVETAMSARQLFGIPVWATLSANRLGVIDVPKGVESIVIFADRGEVGMKAAIEAAENFEQKSIAVDIIPPRVHFGDRYSDFNDVVRECA